MWKIYTWQLHEWESAVNRMQGSSNGYQEKGYPQNLHCLPSVWNLMDSSFRYHLTDRSRDHIRSFGDIAFWRELDGFYRQGTKCMFCSKIISSCFFLAELFLSKPSGRKNNERWGWEDMSIPWRRGPIAWCTRLPSVWWSLKRSKRLAGTRPWWWWTAEETPGMKNSDNFCP